MTVLRTRLRAVVSSFDQVFRKPETIEFALARIVHARSAPAHVLRPERLNIALCVSGQLRGFHQAAESWKAFGFDTHNTVTFVSVWADIGGRIPDGPTTAARCFTGEFLGHFVTVGNSMGFGNLLSRYPTLLDGVQRSQHITKSALQECYETPFVEIENENDSQFESFSNVMKMYHKTARAAGQSGE